MRYRLFRCECQGKISKRRKKKEENISVFISKRREKEAEIYLYGFSIASLVAVGHYRLFSCEYAAHAHKKVLSRRIKSRQRG